MKRVFKIVIHALLVINFVSGTPCFAATIIVNTTSDVSFSDLSCTLREAIESANNDNANSSGCIDGSPGLDEVRFDESAFPRGESRKITLIQGQLDVRDDLAIAGPGMDSLEVDANNRSRVFYVRGYDISISDLTISGGTVNSSVGAGIRVDRASSLNHPNLDLYRTKVTNNSACLGGGISVTDLIGDNEFQTIRIVDSIISNNTAPIAESLTCQEAGLSILGNYEATIINSEISGNHASGNGGGISILATASLRLINSLVSGNSTGNDGGGISIDTNGQVSIERSTISNNTAGGSGGAIASRSDNGNFLNLSTSTISGNSARLGAGLHLLDTPSSMTCSTVANNQAELSGGGVFLARGDSDSDFFAEFNIFTNNRALVGNELATNRLTDGTARVFQSLIGDNAKSTAATVQGPIAIEQSILASSDGARPTPWQSLIAPLSNNSRGLATHELVAGSPAIDFGDCAQFSGLDQNGRERTRPSDLGAVEFFDDSSCYVVKAKNGNVVTFCL